MIAEPTPKQRVHELFRSSPRILILIAPDQSVDVICAASVLGGALTTLGKVVTFFAPAGISRSLDGFITLPNVITELTYPQEYFLRLTSPGLEIAELSLEPQSEGYQVKLAVTKGSLTLDQLSLSEGSLPIDLVVIIGSATLDQVPSLSESTRSALLQRPMVVIDRVRPVTPFSTVSLIDEGAASLCELMVGILEGLSGDQSLLKPEQATVLLLGLVNATESFRGKMVTPKSLTVAAQLIASGAKKDTAFAALQSQRALPTLKLWGRLLSRLTIEGDSRLAWSYVTKEDLLHAGASEVEVPRVIDELLTSLEGVDHIVVLLQQTDQIVAFIRKVAGLVGAVTIAQRAAEPEATITGDETEAYCTLPGRLIDRGREIIGRFTLQSAPTPPLEPSADQVALDD